MKPISRKLASLPSNWLSVPLITAPKTLDGLFALGGDGGSSEPLKAGESGGVKRSWCLRGNVEDAERREKPNRLPGLGGRGGGSSPIEPVLVLPVFCLTAGFAPPPPAMKALCSYFCRMNFSIVASASSMSTGIAGLTFCGLKSRLDFVFPSRFMLSTCSPDQLSMLKLLTFETCVPSLRCSAAQRMHRKIPRFHDAHPGFFALQSAQRSLPETLLMRS